MKKKIFSFKRVSKEDALKELKSLKFDLELCEVRQKNIRNRISDLEKRLGVK